MARQKPLKITDVFGNAAFNRKPLRKAIQSANRSEKASKKLRAMAKKEKKR